jgi:DDE superfamily endonuclease
MAEMAGLDASRFVFLDETGTNTAMARRFGRAPRGQRVDGPVPHRHWKTVTLTAAIRLGDVGGCLAFDGATDAASFETYVESALVPALRRGDIVVMDNLSAHKGVEVERLIRRAGAEVRYLPAYSPDFNPIETDQADCTSSDRWCAPLSAGYDRRRRAARAGRVVPTPPDRDTRRDPMPATARRITPPRA